EAVWLDQGDALPEGCDAVVRARAIGRTGDAFEASEAVAPGENVRDTGSDGEIGEVVRPAGMPVALGAGIVAPVVGATATRSIWPHIVCVHTAKRSRASLWPSSLFSRFGCQTSTMSGETPELLRTALSFGHGNAVVILGGTGEGRDDATVSALAEFGAV